MTHLQKSKAFLKNNPPCCTHTRSGFCRKIVPCFLPQALHRELQFRETAVHILQHVWPQHVPAAEPLLPSPHPVPQCDAAPAEVPRRNEMPPTPEAHSLAETVPPVSLQGTTAPQTPAHARKDELPARRFTWTECQMSVAGQARFAEQTTSPDAICHQKCHLLAMHDFC